MNSFSRDDFLSSANKFLGRLATKFPTTARALDFKLPEKFSYVSITVEYLMASDNPAASKLIEKADFEGRDIMVVRDKFLVGNKQRLIQTMDSRRKWEVLFHTKLSYPKAF